MKNKYIYWTVAISNVAGIVAFTTLAIIFNRWWIVLFDMPFFLTYKSKTVQKHYRICDKCGRHGPEKGTYYADGLPLWGIAKKYGVDQSVVSRTIKRARQNLWEVMRYTHPRLLHAKMPNSNIVKKQKTKKFRAKETRI